MLSQKYFVCIALYSVFYMFCRQVLHVFIFCIVYSDFVRNSILYSISVWNKLKFKFKFKLKFKFKFKIKIQIFRKMNKIFKMNKILKINKILKMKQILKIKQILKMHQQVFIYQMMKKQMYKKISLPTEVG